MTGKLNNHNALVLANIMGAWSMAVMLKQFFCDLFYCLLIALSKHPLLYKDFQAPTHVVW